MPLGESWPVAVRERARELYEETGHSPAQTVSRLESELGVTVPRATVQNWVRGRPLAPSAQTVDGQAMRLLRLCSSELGRLERQTRHLDLDRAGKVAQILKTIEPLTRSKRSTARTLADLNGSTGTSADAQNQSYSTVTELSDLTVEPADLTAG